MFGPVTSIRRIGAPLVLLVTLLASGCGGRGGLPPELPPVIKGPDGREYRLLDRGKYKGIYDQWGRLQRIDYDSNGDGKIDHVAHHDGEKSPHQLDIDEDFDGRFDRWEEYDPAGRLTKVGVSRRHTGAPDLWLTPGPGDQPLKKEYDDNGDMRVDRTEHLRAGLVMRVELDTDGDGRVDRWQNWSTGRLSEEDFDTNADGQADRRLVYGPKGNVLKMEPLSR
jgi:hypothetical protein